MTTIFAGGLRYWHLIEDTRIPFSIFIMIIRVYGILIGIQFIRLRYTLGEM